MAVSLAASVPPPSPALASPPPTPWIAPPPAPVDTNGPSGTSFAQTVTAYGVAVTALHSVRPHCRSPLSQREPEPVLWSSVRPDDGGRQPLQATAAANAVDDATASHHPLWVRLLGGCSACLVGHPWLGRLRGLPVLVDCDAECWVDGRAGERTSRHVPCAVLDLRRRLRARDASVLPVEGRFLREWLQSLHAPAPLWQGTRIDYGCPTAACSHA